MHQLIAGTRQCLLAMHPKAWPKRQPVLTGFDRVFLWVTVTFQVITNMFLFPGYENKNQKPFSNSSPSREVDRKNISVRLLLQLLLWLSQEVTVECVHCQDAVVEELSLFFPKSKCLAGALFSNSEASFPCSTMAEWSGFSFQGWWPPVGDQVDTWSFLSGRSDISWLSLRMQDIAALLMCILRLLALCQWSIQWHQPGYQDTVDRSRLIWAIKAHKYDRGLAGGCQI